MIDCATKTDREIVAIIGSGDIGAFYCLVETYEAKLLKYILRITNVDLEEAENLLQEVFIKVYKNIHEFNYDLSFSSWIYRIAHNITIDYYRKHKDTGSLRLQATDEEYSNLIELLESPVNLEDDYQRKELIQQMTAILDLLDPKFKEVLVLKFLEEKNYSEISDILKIPEGTVATLINRGKKQFKTLSEEHNLPAYM